MWQGSLLAPQKSKRFFGASVADDAALRIEATQKKCRQPVNYVDGSTRSLSLTRSFYMLTLTTPGHT